MRLSITMYNNLDNNYCYNETTFIFPNKEIYTKFLCNLNNNLLLTFISISNFSNEELDKPKQKKIYNIEVVEENIEALRIQVLFDTISKPPIKFYEKIFKMLNVIVTTLYYNIYEEYYGMCIFENMKIYCKEYDFPHDKKQLIKTQLKLYKENILLYDFMKYIFDDFENV